MSNIKATINECNFNLLNSVNFSNASLCSIKEILDNAESKVMWGQRVVAVGKSSIPLNILIDKLFLRAEKHLKNDQLTTEERIAALDTVAKLRKWNSLTIKEVKNSNFFIRLINWFREPWFKAYTSHEAICESRVAFCTYSEAKFTAQFGPLPVDITDSVVPSIKMPLLIPPPKSAFVRESVIRSLEASVK
jgi:hypothetical protein